jgi:transcriptional regulator with XRE-family HTH domain
MSETEAGSRRLGAKLRALRMECGWTLAEMATALKVDADHIEGIEGGRELPDCELLLDIAHGYDVSVWTVCGVTVDEGGITVPPSDGPFRVAHGRTSDEASANLAQAKVDSTPYWKLSVPEDLTSVEFEALIVSEMRKAQNAAWMANSLLRIAPSRLINDQFRRSAAANVHEVSTSATQLCAVMERTPYDILTFFMLKLREGQDPSSFKIQLGPKKAGENESQT